MLVKSIYRNKYISKKKVNKSLGQGTNTNNKRCENKTFHNVESIFSFFILSYQKNHYFCKTKKHKEIASKR